MRASTKMPGAIISTLLMVITGYAVLSFAVFLFQSKLLYFPQEEIIADPGRVGLEYQTVNFITDDNVKLYGWYIPAADPRAVLVFFHGNAGNISHRLDSLIIFHRLGLSTLIFDYRGYGQSGGDISEQGSYDDAAAALRYLVSERHIPQSDIILFGRSLGGAIAAHLASRSRPKALIIESSFTSIPDLAAELYPFLPVRLLSRFQYNTRQSLASVACPVLIIHSRDDEIIPFQQGRELFSAANTPKEFLEISGDHNGGFLANEKPYVQGLNRFIGSLVNVQ